MQAFRTAALLLIANVVGFGTAWQLASAQAEKAKLAQKWEYKTTSFLRIDEMAEDGWELGWVTPLPGVDGVGELNYTWKRPK